ncbi:helix-turn-helix domain-containing protein, partial [Bacteroides xylanisolvens]
DSITQAAQKLNLNYATVRRYIKRKIKPQNGWQWFLEKDNNWIKHIDDGKAE